MPTTYAIPNGRTVMDATTYAGTGATNNVLNQFGFKPDLVWVKNRGVNSHQLSDSVRGVNLALASDLTIAEYAGNINAFNTNGFQVTTSSNAVNNSGQNYVGWQWQAGQSSTSSNTQGSITSTVSANTTAGFSIVTYTGTGSNATVGHGLGVAPAMIIVKCRSNDDWWPVYHASLGATKDLRLNETAAAETLSNIWNNTAPTSSVFSIGTSTETGASARTYVAYCWAQVAGFSQFGSYTGNGSSDGPFVYLGFRPKFVLIKRTDSTADWYLYDTSRSPYNYAYQWLRPDTSDAENTTSTSNNWEIDILSNGFKVRNNGAFDNASGGTYIYACFAENPLKYANAR